MKRIVIFLLMMAFAVMLALPACKNGSTDAKKSAAKKNKDGSVSETTPKPPAPEKKINKRDPNVIVMNYFGDWKPYSWVEKGKMQGILIDIAEKALVKRMGLKASHKGYPWARAQELVKSGEEPMGL